MTVALPGAPANRIARDDIQVPEIRDELNPDATYVSGWMPVLPIRFEVVVEQATELCSDRIDAVRPGLGFNIAKQWTFVAGSSSVSYLTCGQYRPSST